jgi:hypothetical protein
MTDMEYTRLKSEIRRLEAGDPSPHHSSAAAVKLYTLKTAALAYEQGVFPATEALPVAAMAQVSAPS